MQRFVIGGIHYSFSSWLSVNTGSSRHHGRNLLFRRQEKVFLPLDNFSFICWHSGAIRKKATIENNFCRLSRETLSFSLSAFCWDLSIAMSLVHTKSRLMSTTNFQKWNLIVCNGSFSSMAKCLPLLITSCVVYCSAVLYSKLKSNDNISYIY